MGLPVGVLALFVLVAFLLGPPDSSPVRKELEQPVQPALAPGSRDIAHGVLVVEIELEEGDFDIRPIRMGRSIRVDADYDEAFYQLRPTYAADSGGTPHFSLVFEHRGRLRQLRRLVHARRTAKENRVGILLPADVPMDLSLHIRRGQAVIDLSGLMLRRVVVDHAMGDTEVRFEEPNPVEMESLEIRGRMGALDVSGLGHAAARDLVLNGQMGEFRLDFGGSWRTDTRAAIGVTMGDARVRLPPEVGLQISDRKVLFGSLTTGPEAPPPGPEGARERRTLVLEASVRFGDLQVR